jgi:lupus La protein
MSNDTEKIAERLEFFFSDANLRMDRFLRRIVLDKETGGFVDIDTLLKFNTIKSISTDPSTVADAVEKVAHPQLKLNEARTAIARVEPFTEDMLKDNIKVSLRIGNIPIEDGNYVHSREEIEKLFSEFGKVVLVRLTTNYDKKEGKRIALGKGFVEFADVESMERAVAELCVSSENGDGKPLKVLKLGENELTVKSMQQWLDKKASEKGSKKETKAVAKRAREEEESKEREEIEAIEFKLEWKKGCVISLVGLPETCDREMLLDVVKKNVGEGIEARADYSRGDKDGKIRFSEPSDKISEFATQLNDGTVTIGGAKVEKATVLTGEEEEDYYKNFIAFKTKQMRDKAQEKLDRKKRLRQRDAA